MEQEVKIYYDDEAFEVVDGQGKLLVLGTCSKVS